MDVDGNLLDSSLRCLSTKVLLKNYKCLHLIVGCCRLAMIGSSGFFSDSG